MTISRRVLRGAALTAAFAAIALSATGEGQAANTWGNLGKAIGEATGKAAKQGSKSLPEVKVRPNVNVRPKAPGYGAVPPPRPAVRPSSPPPQDVNVRPGGGYGAIPPNKLPDTKNYGAIPNKLPPAGANYGTVPNRLPANKNYGKLAPDGYSKAPPPPRGVDSAGNLPNRLPDSPGYGALPNKLPGSPGYGKVSNTIPDNPNYGKLELAPEGYSKPPPPLGADSAGNVPNRGATGQYQQATDSIFGGSRRSGSFGTPEGNYGRVRAEDWAAAGIKPPKAKPSAIRRAAKVLAVGTPIFILGVGVGMGSMYLINEAGSGQ